MTKPKRKETLKQTAIDIMHEHSGNMIASLVGHKKFIKFLNRHFDIRVVQLTQEHANKNMGPPLAVKRPLSMRILGTHYPDPIPYSWQKVDSRKWPRLARKAQRRRNKRG